MGFPESEVWTQEKSDITLLMRCDEGRESGDVFGSGGYGLFLLR